MIPCRKDCKICNTTGACTSCNDGYFLDGTGNCLVCDNTKCGTC